MLTKILQEVNEEKRCFQILGMIFQETIIEIEVGNHVQKGENSINEICDRIFRISKTR
jgi:hypothetical protein